MSQEFFEFNNLIAIRKGIVVPDQMANTALNEFGKPFGELFRNRSKDRFRNNFSKYVRRRRTEYNTPAYQLAGYLLIGADNLWEGLSELMRSKRKNEGRAGALVFDMGMGMRDVLYPLVVAHAEYNIVAPELQEELRPFGNQVFR